MYRIKIQIIPLTILYDKKCPGVLSSDEEKLIFPEMKIDHNMHILEGVRNLIGKCFNLNENVLPYKLIDVHQQKDDPRHKKDTVFITYSLKFPYVKNYIKNDYHVLQNADQIDNKLLQRAIQSI